MSQLAKAFELASRVFVDKTDKGGEPYILHCVRVMNNLDTTDEELKAIAMLHDVVEDTDTSLKDLTAHGFSNRVVDAVRALTKFDKTLEYQDYIETLVHNNDARLVKLADLKDNSLITRLKGVSFADFKRMQKYHIAYTYLSKV